MGYEYRHNGCRRNCGYNSSHLCVRHIFSIRAAFTRDPKDIGNFFQNLGQRGSVEIVYLTTVREMKELLKFIVNGQENKEFENFLRRPSEFPEPSVLGDE